ncbi:hypothetical protein [Luteolibacter sp. Populi]|uniref:hypothetical protein n=1 Tax=Luteolibacter sp. Populi TaxID=3230487 RepID=UPI003466B267
MSTATALLLPHNARPERHARPAPIKRCSTLSSFFRLLVLLIASVAGAGGALADERQQAAFIDSRAKFDGLILKVVGSNPTPATTFKALQLKRLQGFFCIG